MTVPDPRACSDLTPTHATGSLAVTSRRSMVCSPRARKTSRAYSANTARDSIAGWGLNFPIAHSSPWQTGRTTNNRMDCPEGAVTLDCRSRVRRAPASPFLSSVHLGLTQRQGFPSCSCCKHLNPTSPGCCAAHTALYFVTVIMTNDSIAVSSKGCRCCVMCASPLSSPRS
ncbi:hypothetical protein CCHR01_18639 [Colletotrichum chrysophilum]|uniref:Uncharacterized protein n=1 Tax=Colletotrichum chrysophilum TaxID=1836956 RepID=A0AAD9EB96_9PEZI|nr:hypothetical protein CCHR01_18639 [Colletotrichum chrysophilum]